MTPQSSQAYEPTSAAPQLATAYASKPVKKPHALQEGTLELAGGLEQYSAEALMKELSSRYIKKHLLGEGAVNESGEVSGMQLEEVVKRYREQNQGADAKQGLSILESMTGEIHRLVLETLLDTEMTYHLGYKRYEQTPSEEKSPEAGPEQGGGEEGRKPKRKNCRNGSYERTVRTKNGEITISHPRDRSGLFSSLLIPKGRLDLTGSEDRILELVARGNSVRDIVAIFKDMFGADVSPAYVQLIIDGFHAKMKAWQERSLKPFYPFIFIDCTYVSLRSEQGRVSKKPVYMILGIDMSGRKELLSLEIIGDTENKQDWMNVFDKLQQRGLKDVLFVCMDGVSGVADGIRAIFPKAVTQRCIVHMIRNSCELIGTRDRKEWCADLKPLYKSPDLESARRALEDLEEKWMKRAPAAVRFWKRNFDEHVAPLYDYPSAIRRIIYTNNAAEATNSSLKEVVKKGCYNSNEGVLTAMVLRLEKVLSTNWRRRPVRNWAAVLNQLLTHSDSAELVARYREQ